MHRPLLVLMLAGAFLVAGCTTRPSTGPGDDAQTSAPTQIDYALGECQASIVLFLVPPEHAQDRLPPGYTYRDASTISPLPLDEGNALVALAAFKCAEATWGHGPLDWGFLGILIEAPDRSDIAPEPVAFELYLLEYYTDNAQQLAGLDAMHFAATQASMMFAAPSPAGPFSLEATDSDGHLFSLQTVPVPAEKPVTPGMRHWHAHDDGVLVWNYAFEATERVGRTIDCTLRPGAGPADATGRVDCFGTTPPTLLEASLGGEASVRFLPNASAP